MTTRIQHRMAFGLMGLMLMGAAAVPVSAAQWAGPDVAVHYADLDITTMPGAEKLYERIQQAALKVCPNADSKLLVQNTAVMRCRNEVVAHAVRSVSSPQVTAVFAARAHHGVRSPV